MPSTLSSSRARCPRERRPRGRRWPRPPAVVKKQEAKKVVNPLFRRGLRTSALGRTSSPREISRASSNGPATLGCSGRGPSSISGSKFLLPLTSSPRPWTGKQLPSCLNLPTSTGQRPSRKRSRGCWPVLRRKLPAKGMSRLRDHLSFERASIQSPLW